MLQMNHEFIDHRGSESFLLFFLILTFIYVTMKSKLTACQFNILHFTFDAYITVENVSVDEVSKCFELKVKHGLILLFLAIK